MRNKRKLFAIGFLSIFIFLFMSYGYIYSNNTKENPTYFDEIAALDSSSSNITVISGTGIELRRIGTLDSNISSYIESFDNSIYKYTCKKGLFTSKKCSVTLGYYLDSNYEFLGWSEKSCSNGTYTSKNATINVSFDSSSSKSMYACTKKKDSTTKTTTTTTTSSSKSNLKLLAGRKVESISLSVSGSYKTLVNTTGMKSYSCSSSTCRIFDFKFKFSDGYEFAGLSNDNCNTLITEPTISEFYFTPKSSHELVVCAKEKNITTNLSISTQNSNVTLGDYVKVSNTDKIIVTENTNSSQKFSCDGSGNVCSVKVTANPKEGYKFDGWSSDGCSSIKFQSNTVPLTFSSSTNHNYVACVSKINAVTPTSTKPITTKPVVTEPVVKDTFTFNYNDYVYAKGNEYQGKTIKCGDKLYISVCTNDNDPICKVTSINGNSVSNTQIRKSNFVKNESETGCFNEITRYIKEKTYYFSNSNLSEGKTEIGCGATVTFKESIDKACSAGSCKVYYNNNLVYISNDKIVSDKPVCDNLNENMCVTSDDVKNVKDSVSVKICKKDDNENKRNSIVTCAEDYEKSYKLITDTCDNNKDDCYKEYKYTCNYVKRPGVSATAGILKSNGYGTLSITGQDNGNIGLKGYYISNGDAPTENSNWISFSNNNSATVEKTAGTYFIWTMNNKNRISYQVMAKVYDSELSTTLSSVNITDENGDNVSINSLDNTIGYTGELVDGQYALLSNNLIADTKIGGFDKLTTAYEISVASNKVAIYTTLTSGDASYVSGFEPRTIDLDYGRNVALIKIVNKNGRERTYTFIINRVDDRSNSNILNDITLSKGKIDFDPYTTNYTVKIPKSTKLVSVNAELNSQTASFIKYYEPREVQISEDVQSVVLKVISEAGSIRSYVITFVKSDIKDDSKNSSYLSSLTVPGTQLGFDKETYDYTITVPYDTESIPIYAFAESEKATVTIGNNTGLKVGNNLIEIEVKNGSNIKVYNLHVIRKESGLDIANSAKLGLLSIKNYNIDFNPDILDYIVKIKREKSLLITASPESNRADIYMYGNNDLTGFSTVRVKVIAENGLTNIYSIDIQKSAYNKKIEIIAAISGGIIVITTGSIMLIRKRRQKMKEYLEG